MAKGTPPEAPPQAPPRMSSTPKILDLTGDPDRPTVRMDSGDFKMRLPEELTFEEFGRQIQLGKLLTERAGHVDEDGVLDELQLLVVEAGQMLLIDLSTEEARKLTPGMYLKISQFFNESVGSGATEIESGTSSAPGASDSTGAQEAD